MIHFYNAILILIGDVFFIISSALLGLSDVAGKISDFCINRIKTKEETK